MIKITAKIGGILLLAIALVVVLLYANGFFDIMPHLKEREVEFVQLETFDGRQAQNLDIKTFLKYYNAIYDVRKDDNHGETTPSSRITIQLKSGESIIFWQNCEEIDIELKEEQYWGKQQNIFNLLKSGEY